VSDWRIVAVRSAKGRPFAERKTTIALPVRSQPSSGLIVNIVVNGEPREVATGATIAQLLVALRLDPRTLAVELNLDVIPRGRHAECLLHDGDRLEIVTLVGGG
jgi:sulfur carrier protein